MSNSRTVNGPGFRIRYEDRPGYLRAHVFDGTDSPQVSVAMWRMLGSEFQAVGAQRMLVLEDLQATVEAQDVADVIDAIELAGFAQIRTAFVELREDVQGSEMGEIMCRERRIVMRVFSNEELARRWLLFDE